MDREREYIEWPIVFINQQTSQSTICSDYFLLVYYISKLSQVIKSFDQGVFIIKDVPK